MSNTFFPAKWEDEVVESGGFRTFLSRPGRESVSWQVNGNDFGILNGCLKLSRVVNISRVSARRLSGVKHQFTRQNI